MADDNDRDIIDPKAHQALADAHERLKKDSKADRDALKALQDQVAELTAAKDDAESAAAAKAGDIEAVKAQLEAKHARELKTVTDRAEKAEGQVRKLVVDNGLDAALDAASVSPALKRAAKALLRDGVELKTENDEPVALMAGVALADAVKTWAGTDEGKHFILNGNTGGDAPGGKDGPSAEPNPWKADTKNLTKQGEILRSDPTKAERLKREAGVS